MPDTPQKRSAIFAFRKKPLHELSPLAQAAEPDDRNKREIWIMSETRKKWIRLSHNKRDEWLAAAAAAADAEAPRAPEAAPAPEARLWGRVGFGKSGVGIQCYSNSTVIL